MTDYRWILLDFVLITLAIYLSFTQEWFAGGFGWFLLLGLSPNAHKSRFF